MTQGSDGSDGSNGRGARPGTPAERLLGEILGSWKAQAVRVAAELGIPDLLASGPRSAGDLAAVTGADPESLGRLLRALTTLDVCREPADGVFELGALGHVLRADAPDSVRHWAIWWGTSLWAAWGNLPHSIRTGGSARAALTGKEGFGHLAADLGAAAVFHQAMVELTRLEAAGVVGAFEFGGVRTVADLGGGHGELLKAILTAHPGITGLLFDLPHAVEGARANLAAAGLGGRCECRAGDFWEEVPEGCELYVLKSVLHDWADEACLRLLARCRRAMRPEARLLVVERVLPERMGTSARDQEAVRSDLTMLVALGARERSACEFQSLLERSGFRVVRTRPTAGALSLLEAVPA